MRDFDLAIQELALLELVGIRPQSTELILDPPPAIDPSPPHSSLYAVSHRIDRYDPSTQSQWTSIVPRHQVPMAITTHNFSVLYLTRSPSPLVTLAGPSALESLVPVHSFRSPSPLVTLAGHSALESLLPVHYFRSQSHPQGLDALGPPVPQGYNALGLLVYEGPLGVPMS